MINMAFMPLYMWEMWDVTPVTDEHTDSRKVEQYSVWTESAIGICARIQNYFLLAIALSIMQAFESGRELRSVSSTLKGPHIALAEDFFCTDSAVSFHSFPAPAAGTDLLSA